MKRGDLVTCFDVNVGNMVGVLLEMKPMEGCFRDSSGSQQVFLCTVLFDRDVPQWMGAGRIAEVAELSLEVVS